MVRTAAHFLGLWVLAIAFAALAIDASRSLAAGALIVTQIGQTAAAFAPAKLAALQNAIDPHLHPLIEQALTKVLRLPTFLALGLAGALILRLGRKPQPKIGYSSR